MNDYNKINADLINFWNEAFKLTDEDKKEINEMELSDPVELAPSKILADAAISISNSNHILDYGCGSGWASLIMAKYGSCQIDAVDMGTNIIELVNLYASLYNLSNQINAFVIGNDWLSTVNDNSYDALLCSNVLDVVTLDVTLKLIQEFHRILKPGSKLVIGLNFYMSNEDAKKRNMELIDGKYLIVNGILRLNSLSDEEWKKLFEPYFDLIALTYFAWPNEVEEKRRLFVLKNK